MNDKELRLAELIKQIVGEMIKLHSERGYDVFLLEGMIMGVDLLIKLSSSSLLLDERR